MSGVGEHMDVLCLGWLKQKLAQRGSVALRYCGPAALWHCILSRVTPKYQNLTTYPSTNLLRRVESSVILEYVSNDNFKNFGGAVLSYSDWYLFQE